MKTLPTLPSEIVDELRTSLETFAQKYGKAVEDCAGDEQHEAAHQWVQQLTQLIELWKIMSKGCLAAVTDIMMMWRAQMTCNPNYSLRVCNWLVGRILQVILDPSAHEVSSESNFRAISALTILDLCFDQCSLDLQLTRRPSKTFFTLRKVSEEPTTTEQLDQRTQQIWRQVLGHLSLETLSQIHVRLESELSSLPKGSSTDLKIQLLRSFSDVQLHLCSPTSMLGCDFETRVRQVSAFLQAFQSSLTKHNKSVIRQVAMKTIASIFHRELHDKVDEGMLPRLYSCNVRDWVEVLMSLRKLAVRLSTRKGFSDVAWDLRIGILCLSKQEDFRSWYKDDINGITTYFVQSRNFSTLQTLGFLTKNVLRRHQASQRQLPSCKEIMTIFQLLQRGCFSIPKQKDMNKFVLSELPILVDISKAMALYDMKYTLVHHLQELIIDADAIFHERKLVGLESMVSIVEQLQLTDQCFYQDKNFTLQSLSHSYSQFHVHFDPTTVFQHQKLLCEILSQVLIECNTHFGKDLVLSQNSTSAESKLSATKQALGLHLFYTAINGLRFFYSSIDLTSEQKMLILANCAIHASASIRNITATVLEALALQNEQVNCICSGLAAYIENLPDEETLALELLLDLVHRVLSNTIQAFETQPGTYATINAAITRLESMCLVLLCGLNAPIRVRALKFLAQLREFRQQLLVVLPDPGDLHGERFESSTTQDLHEAENDIQALSVMDVIEGIDDELTQYFCLPELARESTLPPEAPTEGHGRLVWILASTESTEGNHFQWANCLAILFTRVCEALERVTTLCWHHMNSKAYEVEPHHGALIAGTSTGEEMKDLAKWMHCSIFACTCANLYSRCVSPDDELDADASISPENTISGEAVEHLLERLSRFLESSVLDHLKAVIVALGSSHPSIHHKVLNVLMKLVKSHFRSLPSEPMDQVASKRKGTKFEKQRHQQLFDQLRAQWALARCFRGLIQNLDMSLWLNEIFRTQLFQVLELVHTQTRHYVDPNHIFSESAFVIMLQHDLCAIIQSIVYLSNASICHGPSIYSLPPELRATWFTTLLTWCETSSDMEVSQEFLEELQHERIKSLTCFGQLDVKSDNCPWDWIRPRSTLHLDTEMVQFGISRMAFPTLACLLIGPITSPDQQHMVFDWVDESLAQVDPNAQGFHLFVKQGLRQVLQNNVQFVPDCLSKCFIPLTKSYIALHYLEVLAQVVPDVLEQMENLEKVQIHFLFICLRFLTHANPATRSHAHALLQSLADTRKFTLAPLPHNFSFATDQTLDAQVFIQNSIASELAEHFNEQTYEMIQFGLTQVVQLPMEQMFSFGFLVPWFRNFNFEQLKPCLQEEILALLIACTRQSADHHIRSGEIQSIWETCVQSNDTNHQVVIRYLLFPEHANAASTNLILWWLSRCNYELTIATIFQSSWNTLAHELQALTALATGSCLLIQHPEIIDKYGIQMLHLLFTYFYGATSAGKAKWTEPNVCLLTNLLLCPAFKVPEIEAMIAPSSRVTKASLDELVNYICEHLSNSQRLQWIDFCNKQVTGGDMKVGTRLQLAQIVQKHHYSPSFCFVLTTLLQQRPDEGTLHQLLSTLTDILPLMQPQDVVLFPHLFWSTIELLPSLKHSPELEILVFELIKEFISCPYFFQPTMQHLLHAHHPSGLELYQTLAQGFDSEATLEVAAAIFLELICAPMDSWINKNPEQLLFSTTCLLPWICQHYGNGATASYAALEIGHIWQMHDQMNIANLFFECAGSQFRRAHEFMAAVCPEILHLDQELRPIPGESIVVNALIDRVKWACSPKFLQPILQLLDKCFRHVPSPYSLEHPHPEFYRALQQILQSRQSTRQLRKWVYRLYASIAAMCITPQPSTKLVCAPAEANQHQAPEKHPESITPEPELSSVM